MSDDSKPRSPRHLNGFGMVDPAVMRDPTLPMSAKLVYAYLTTYCSDERTAWPSRATIARDLGISVRTVDSAVSIATMAGLFGVVRNGGDRGGSRQTSNTYTLRDFGDGYLVGSGPQSRGAESSPHGGNDCTPGVQNPAPELDQVNKTSQNKTSHGAAADNSVEDAYAAGAPRASSRGEKETAERPEIRIFVPSDFLNENVWDEGRVCQYLVKAGIGALTDAGYDLDPDAPGRLGSAIKATQAKVVSRAELVRLLKGTLELAGTDDEQWGWIARRRGA